MPQTRQLRQETAGSDWQAAPWASALPTSDVLACDDLLIGPLLEFTCLSGSDLLTVKSRVYLNWPCLPIYSPVHFYACRGSEGCPESGILAQSCAIIKVVAVAGVAPVVGLQQLPPPVLPGDGEAYLESRFSPFLPEAEQN